MKVPTVGTSVFSPVAYTGNGSTRTYSVGFPTDLSINMNRNGAGDSPTWNDRLRGSGLDLYSNSTGSEQNNGSIGVQFDNQTNIVVPSYRITNGTPYIDWCMRRAAGFFDEVCYTGFNQFTGAAGFAAQSITHNLTVAPEFMIVKSRGATGSWFCYFASNGNSSDIFLNDTSAKRTGVVSWNEFTPTSTTFQVNAAAGINSTGATYVAWLFATTAGVSKVGTYTGTGALQTVNCGFTTGARFVLIKSTSTSGSWYVWDSARGIVAGDDPYLLLNSVAAEVTNTDWVDTASTGFELSNTGGNLANSNGVSYIFLAIA
jgi:hypothetical protein